MPPNAFDFEKLLRFFQDLYAHALTLQDLMSKDDERRYEDVKPTYDLQASEQFELFYRALNQPEAFATAVKAFLDTHPKTDRIQ